MTRLEGAITVDLDELEPGEAVELLGKVGGLERVAGEPEAVAELAYLCGYSPWAVRIVGHRLIAKRHWRVTAYAEWLRDERQRLRELRAGDLEVRASFALSYQALSEDKQQAFRLLESLDAPDFQAWVVDFAVEVVEEYFFKSCVEPLVFVTPWEPYRTLADQQMRSLQDSTHVVIIPIVARQDRRTCVVERINLKTVRNIEGQAVTHSNFMNSSYCLGRRATRRVLLSPFCMYTQANYRGELEEAARQKLERLALGLCSQLLERGRSWVDESPLVSKGYGRRSLCSA